MKRLDAQGREILDPTPVAIPAGFKEPMSLEERIQRIIRTEVSRAAENQGMETFEESEDFEVDDENDPFSPFETFFDPVLGRDMTLEEFHRNQAVYRQQHIDRTAQAARAQDAAEAAKEALEEAKSRRRRRRTAKPSDASGDPEDGDSGRSEPPASGKPPKAQSPT